MTISYVLTIIYAVLQTLAVATSGTTNDSVWHVFPFGG